MQAQALKLRVPLAPGTSFSTTHFIAGPEYVVMLYNLYGTHTLLPGPKADRAFVQKILANMVFNYAWFADATTINYCISLAKEDGIKNIELWRLGGNSRIENIK